MTQDEKPNSPELEVHLKPIETPIDVEAQKLKEDQTTAQLRTIEALQLELQQNPKSLSFIQLADLYLSRDMIDEALELTERSLRFNPKSTSGIIVLAKIHKAKNEFQKALNYLDIAIARAPSNWHALLLRAETHLKARLPKKALADFKKVMLLNPQNLYARKAIAKLEVLTADEYEDDVFEMQSVHASAHAVDNAPDDSETAWKPMSTQMERVLSLVDAFTVRHEYERSLKLLHECRAEFGDHPEIQTRLLRLSQHESAQKIRPKAPPEKSRLRESMVQQKQQKALELLLQRIQELRPTSV